MFLSADDNLDDILMQFKFVLWNKVVNEYVTPQNYRFVMKLPTLEKRLYLLKAYPHNASAIRQQIAATFTTSNAKSFTMARGRCQTGTATNSLGYHEALEAAFFGDGICVATNGFTQNWSAKRPRHDLILQFYDLLFQGLGFFFKNFNWILGWFLKSKDNY